MMALPLRDNPGERTRVSGSDADFVWYGSTLETIGLQAVTGRRVVERLDLGAP